MTYKNFQFDLNNDGIATVLIDRGDESMNTLGEALLTELVEVVDRLEQDDVNAVVIGSAKSDFLAGADIRMFAQMTTADQAVEALTFLHDVYNRIEDLHKEQGKPVVAAIHGACLGGGLELALTCSSRICSTGQKTHLGQPEVQLGLIPGGGGTQRLPELIGLGAGLEMIMGGKPVRPYKAKKLGLVDETVPAELLLQIAQQRATDLIDATSDEQRVGLDMSTDGLQKFAIEKNPAGRKLLWKKAYDTMMAQTKGHYPAPKRAFEAVRIGAEQGRAAGTAAEIRFFAELVMTAESAALQSLFFATTALKSDTGIDSNASPIKVSHVAVLGGGLMGGGIAAVTTLEAKKNVRIKEIDAAGVGRGLAYVDKVVLKHAKRRRMSPFEVDQVLNRVTGSSTWTGFGNTDVVIEAVFEDLDLKRSIAKDVEGVMREDVIFASNTSTLPITLIAEASDRPEQVVGMHYFSPVEKMPLLEIITTDMTADWVTATAVQLGKDQGKTVIVVNDGTGFYTSRILGPYSNEAAFLLEEGASVQAIDMAMEDWGFAVGPLLLADEVGIDVGAHVAIIMHDAFGDRMRGPDMMKGLIEDERKGRKNGRGFYIYDDGTRAGVDPTVYDALGVGPRVPVSKKDVTERLTLAFINEAALCLQEGILRSARDGDVGAVFGLGYPPFRGGPFFTVDQMG
ncbi:MAG: 3-hydroxyacyl-CoA dehydrogenase NAD-binding domain-containing protein, partial [Actinomycetia bacterium]|nr:3-hydroxyacyl-CoA dehydrogenase NAD-binding domain-containing protein [Actinomycetes bacterium]